MLPRVATLFMLSKHIYVWVMDLYDSAWLLQKNFVQLTLDCTNLLKRFHNLDKNCETVPTRK